MTGNRSTASASLGAPTEAMVTMTETAAASSVGAEGMAPTMVTSTTEGDTVDLEMAMLKGIMMMTFMVRSIAQHQKTEQIGVRQG